jgi:hypothetical protein
MMFFTGLLLEPSTTLIRTASCADAIAVKEREMQTPINVSSAKRFFLITETPDYLSDFMIKALSLFLVSGLW